VTWLPAWELVRELQFSYCEPLLLEAGSWSKEIIQTPREREHLQLEAITRQWLVETLTD
jgi:hypothetical protein